MYSYARTYCVACRSVLQAARHTCTCNYWGQGRSGLRLRHSKSQPARISSSMSSHPSHVPNTGQAAPALPLAPCPLPHGERMKKSKYAEPLPSTWMQDRSSTKITIHDSHCCTISLPVLLLLVWFKGAMKKERKKKRRSGGGGGRRDEASCSCVLCAELVRPAR